MRPRSSGASDRIDRVVTNRWLGIPIFFGLMYLVFSLCRTWPRPIWTGWTGCSAGR